MNAKRRKPKTATFTVRLEQDLLNQLRAIARAEDRPLNSIMRRAAQQLVGPDKFVQPASGILVHDPVGRVAWDGAERRAK